MSRWSRVIRGMLGTGLTFSVGVGVVGSMVAAVAGLVTGLQGGIELIRFVFASAIWAFPMGVAFSGVLSLTARGRSFDELSLPGFAGLGAGAGLLLFGVLALNAWDAWSMSTAMVNAGLFVLLGGGSATATLTLARKAGPVLESGGESPELESGDGSPTLRSGDGPSTLESADVPPAPGSVHPTPGPGER